MVTMRDAVDAYDKRYYGGNGNDLLEQVASKRLPRPEVHDIFHVIASGLANLNLSGEELENHFRFLDEKGLVGRNAGIKAELLQDIYRTGISGSFVTYQEMERYFKTAIIPIFERYISGKFDGTLSHIPELKELLAGYRGLKDRENAFEEIITAEEIEFHVHKASDLYSKLIANHPDCFNGLIPDFNKLLELDLKEFQIDNFTMAEKIKLRGANLGASNYIRS